jgi:hypothetical protein
MLAAPGTLQHGQLTAASLDSPGSPLFIRKQAITNSWRSGSNRDSEAGSFKKVADRMPSVPQAWCQVAWLSEIRRRSDEVKTGTYSQILGMSSVSEFENAWKNGQVADITLHPEAEAVYEHALAIPTIWCIRWMVT